MFIICILFDNAIIFTKSLEFVKDFKKDKKLAFAMNTKCIIFYGKLNK